MELRGGIKVMLFLTIAILASCETAKKIESESNGYADKVAMWITSGNKSLLLTKVSGNVKEGKEASLPSINIDASKKFQSMDGFGFSLTGGSAMLISKLSPDKRREVLNELFTTEGNGIGISYLRISIGASDLDDHVFSYADFSSGAKKKDISGFTLAEDQKYLIPLLKEILVLNPKIKIMGSPWSAPAWMKTNNHVKGGSLKKEYYSEYAKYFVKYIQGMQQGGIILDAITIQNEPENPNNTPSMLMTAEEQADFVKNHLGPAFEQAGIKTKIVVFDHNCDHPEYPIAILNDRDAKKYVDGSAFHLYLGEISALSKVYEAHPDRNIYFTEQWTSGEGQFDGDLLWHTKELIIGAPRNWSRNVLEWNLANDPQFNPHTDDGGCTICQGALTINGDSVTRNVSYYIIAHASKFVPAGSVRIASDANSEVPNVAYLTPSGEKVVITLNESTTEKKISIKEAKTEYTINLPPTSVATLIWGPEQMISNP
jgi:glucosylceramidase